MRESRTYGFVRGVLSNEHPYRVSLAARRLKAGISFRPIASCRLAPARRPARLPATAGIESAPKALCDGPCRLRRHRGRDARATESQNTVGLGLETDCR